MPEYRGRDRFLDSAASRAVSREQPAGAQTRCSRPAGHGLCPSGAPMRCTRNSRFT